MPLEGVVHSKQGTNGLLHSMSTANAHNATATAGILCTLAGDVHAKQAVNGALHPTNAPTAAAGVNSSGSDMKNATEEGDQNGSNEKGSHFNPIDHIFQFHHALRQVRVCVVCVCMCLREREHNLLYTGAEAIGVKCSWLREAGAEPSCLHLHIPNTFYVCCMHTGVEAA